MRTNDRDAVVATVVTMLHGIVYAPEGSITAQTRLAELDLDSLDLVEAGLELEGIVGRELPDDALQGIGTVGELAARVASDTLPLAA